MTRIQGLELYKFWEQSTPTGTINSSNVVFTLGFAPTEGPAVLVMKNGLVQEQGTDYTISGTTITFTTAPATGSTLKVFYVRQRGE